VFTEDKFYEVATRLDHSPRWSLRHLAHWRSVFENVSANCLNALETAGIKTNWFRVPIKILVGTIMKSKSNVYMLIFHRVHYQYSPSWRKVFVCLSCLSGRTTFNRSSKTIAQYKKSQLQSTQRLWSVRLCLMLQNCGAGRNACTERRILAALQGHSEGNVSGVLVTFAVNSLRPPTIHAQLWAFLKNEVFALRTHSDRTLQLIERNMDLGKYKREDCCRIEVTMIWWVACERC
jgi:hypothetical protein